MSDTPITLGRKTIIILVVVCVLIASGVGYLFYTVVPGRRKDVVAVLPVEGPILTAETTNRYTSFIDHALRNQTVKAVVLSVDSPGGYAHYIEQMYLDLLELNEKKPLVASILLGLSGGYYISVAASYIYVHPASPVGNIGVIGQGPPTLIPSEIVLESGPVKVTGFSKLLFPYNLSHVLGSFVSAVEKGRNESLRLASNELRRGLVYMGSEAVEVGLADEVGSLQKAIQKAAEEAGLVEYEVVDLSRVNITHVSPTSGGTSDHASLEWGNLTIETLNRLHPPPAIYYLYLPPVSFAEGMPQPETLAGRSSDDYSAGTGGRGLVLVDNSHGNKVSAWELDILVAELAKRNMTVRFVSRWADLDAALKNASCLIVASPTRTYVADECERIETFVGKGGMLLLFFDPASEYVEIPALFAPVNSVSTLFGLTFAKGYLYDEEEHYGLYRNVYVKIFGDSFLTRNLSSLVFFTATHIHSMNKGVAWTSGSTYSSTAEKTGNYYTIACVEGDGTVAAFGDQTFLREPYAYVEDNYVLILNLASAIAGVNVTVEENKNELEEEVTKPVLAVGTEKNFTEQVNGDERIARWIKVSEEEVRVERPEQTTHYYFDEEGSLVSWDSDGMDATYEDPLPEPPYPLTRKKSWKYESTYTLTLNGDEYAGHVEGEEAVDGFEGVVAGNGVTYFCARIERKEVDQLLRGGVNMTVVTTGYVWISSDVGTVKEESIILYYTNGMLLDEVEWSVLLRSIRKPPG